MTVQEYFKDRFTYARGLQEWINKYFESVGFKPEYSFASDLAIADWMEGIDPNGVKETYNAIKSGFIDDYKAFTEAVMHINMLSWANDRLSRQGIKDREKWTEFYADLYMTARDDFYDRWEGDKEACSYYFQTTD